MYTSQILVLTLHIDITETIVIHKVLHNNRVLYLIYYIFQRLKGNVNYKLFIEN